ncbi:hypothetical protein [Modicisalibacter tunisiensis]|uniref:Uncharacterized protein n=1 Tax=Modicisalibacter tunisiensis TaxID=390637 RepID=A0ABS7X297_9GAMM|nr:hypothetical protein [Modicisalibacter tunisiensis]MBZ9568509.1 hypothetical protein [Modicisalibacter tunisiensis]
MTDTNRDALMGKARCLDDLNSAAFREWLGLTRQADRLRRDLSNVRAPGRFVAAVAQHGSPSEALRAAQYEVEALTERLHEAAVAGSDAEQDRRELDALLNPVTSDLITKGRTLRERKSALEGERGHIERARTAREKAIGDLVEAGLPRRMADRQAKPTLADIEALEHELAEIPGEIERNDALLTSYAGRMELYLAETTHEEEAA